MALAEVLAALPIETQAMVRRLVANANDAELRVYLVGGPVRDLLLGRAIRDVDLLVESAGDDVDPSQDAPAMALAEQARSASGRVVAHGRFGTVRLEEDGAHVDLASARKETYKRPGALPDVERAGLDEDLLRRDFSVNAMAIPLQGSPEAGTTRVHDPLGGLADLEARRLRVLHDRSFHDDPTRALRAARLGARLDFGLARGTRSALRDALRDGAFGGVSGERFRREVQRCFSDARLGLNPAAALRLLARWHVLPALEPGLDLPREAITPLRRFGRFVAEPLWKSGATPPWQAGMAIWLSALPSPLARRTLARLSIRGEVAKRITDFAKLRESILGRLAKARGRGAVDELLAPIHEDALEALWACSEPAERRRVVRWAAEDRPRRSPLTGADVTALGLAGPDVGRVLARVRAAHLDGDVANREEALALATELAQRPERPKRRPVRAKAKRQGGKAAAKPAARASPKKKSAARRTTKPTKKGRRASRPAPDEA